jgi:hypothetical protein
MAVVRVVGARKLNRRLAHSQGATSLVSLQPSSRVYGFFRKPAPSDRVDKTDRNGVCPAERREGGECRFSGGMAALFVRGAVAVPCTARPRRRICSRCPSRQDNGSWGTPSGPSQRGEISMPITRPDRPFRTINS